MYLILIQTNFKVIYKSIWVTFTIQLQKQDMDGLILFALGLSTAP